MNIPMSWLRDVTKISDDTSSFITKMTESGNAVEGVNRLGADITGVVVGRITEINKHPDADKLWVTRADVGTETLQIVTGADNLKVGDYIPVAVHGSNLANGLKIKKSKMRGQESNGMLCSIEELGYTAADFPEAVEDGIYVFQNLDPEKNPLGSDAKIILELDEDVIDFDVLSNRPDTNSVMGMAREVAAVYNQPFSLPGISLKEKGEGRAEDYITLDVRDTTRCPRYIARVVKNVKIGTSPQWLRRRLSTAGIRPINNIVDITNYVMLEYGQPLHAFDIKTVAVKDGKHGIVVRTAEKGEKITTLDGVERVLGETNLLIADHDKSIGIAGVMGGENSMIHEDTTTILFESANFDSANIRLTARGLGMRTDASARYEKGQDPNQALISVNRAMELIEMLDCGDVVPGMLDSFPSPTSPKIVAFDPREINALLGIGTDILDTEAIRDYLRRVGIKTKLTKNTLETMIPSFRADISGAADLAEEVVRLFGINNIPPRYTQTLAGEAALPGAGKTPRRRREEQIRNTMTALGYFEAATFPFESPKVFDKLCFPKDDPARNSAIPVKNPLNEDYAIMRPSSVIGGLMESLARNYRKGNESAALFEIAFVYHAEALPLTKMPKEIPYLIIAKYGTNEDYLSMKGDVEALLAAQTGAPLKFSPSQPQPYLHPGRSAAVSVKTSPNPRDPETDIGYLGEIHPTVAKNYGIGTRVYVAVLGINDLHAVAESYNFKLTPIYIYPPIDRDLAFKVREDVSAAELEAAIREKGTQLLTEVKLFDVYQGPQVGEGFKSMAYSLRFRDHGRTLATEDVEKPLASIIQNLEKKLSAEIRDK